MSVPRFWRSIPARYRLIGSKCKNCYEIYYPPRKVCPKCRKAKMEEVKLKGRGKIETYTVIHVAPEGFEEQVPYIIAIVRLEEGPCLTTQIVGCEPEDVYIGMPVEACFRRINEDGEAGVIYYGLKFKPVE